MLPVFPVTVKVKVPFWLPAVTVITVEPVATTCVGEKLAFAPAGRPVTLKVTVLLNPVSATTVIVYATELPRTTVAEVGVAVSLNCGACTTSVTAVECTRLPEVPLTVIVYVPAGVVDDVAIVIVDDPVPLTLVGLNVTVAPVGSPLALSPTVPPKPPDPVTDTVYAGLPPAVTVCDDGEAEIVKSPTLAVCTASVTAAECTSVPLVPVIVIV